MGNMPAEREGEGRRRARKSSRQRKRDHHGAEVGYISARRLTERLAWCRGWVHLSPPPGQVYPGPIVAS